MSIIEAIIFGIVQGITEFLPISSTAHIVITQLVLGYRFPGLSFEIFLHLASILAVVIYFSKDLWQVIVGFFSYFKKKTPENRIQFWFAIYIVVATIITGVLGVLLSNMFDESMKSPGSMALALTVTGIALIYIERFHRYGTRSEREMTFKDSVMVGLGQTLSVFPGISRSGATLITALLTGLSRETAVKYSFLLSIPVILGSSVLALDDIYGSFVTDIGVPALITAFVVTFICSWLGIVWLIGFLKRSKLIYFAIYCFVAAALIYLLIDPDTIKDI
ncbi:undecaprenyl-diphosphatase UppP [Sutcliffiella horikoshii]|uniref:undecaprenyl-diphosphatase UppP n=1 Tax=Sutcliffiella horikoshii TaxID=79883 RepID=UPI001EEE369C|nr:undecaprenyl-diphosphatase UppP [Sutcliffiella horikoshii]MCG1022588.1 undecaprenyl-diphosphatase UppP [Sutcliffiella horikoshii]